MKSLLPVLYILFSGILMAQCTLDECGPPPMMEAVIDGLKKMGVTEERIVQEAME